MSPFWNLRSGPFWTAARSSSANSIPFIFSMFALLMSQDLAGSMQFWQPEEHRQLRAISTPFPRATCHTLKSFFCDPYPTGIILVAVCGQLAARPGAGAGVEPVCRNHEHGAHSNHMLDRTDTVKGGCALRNVNPEGMKVVKEEGVAVPAGPDGLAGAFVDQLIAGEVHHDIERAVEYADVSVAETIEEVRSRKHGIESCFGPQVLFRVLQNNGLLLMGPHVIALTEEGKNRSDVGFAKPAHSRNLAQFFGISLQRK